MCLIVRINYSFIEDYQPLEKINSGESSSMVITQINDCLMSHSISCKYLNLLFDLVNAVQKPKTNTRLWL